MHGGAINNKLCPTISPSEQLALEPSRYAPLIKLEDDVSSDNEQNTADWQAEEAESIIGLSLSRAQSRVASSTRRTTQKSNGLHGTGDFQQFDGDFRRQKLSDKSDTAFPESDLQNQSRFNARQITARTQGQTDGPSEAYRISTPWRYDTKAPSRVNKATARLRNSVRTSRLSSASGEWAPEKVWKYLHLNLSLRPNVPTLQPSLTHLENSSIKHPSTASEHRRKKSEGTFTASSASLENNILPHVDQGENALHWQSRRSLQSRATLLRRSTSDTALQLRGSLSEAPSLGDDSRFEHVQDQVNNRLKAMTDSWKDSKLKLPSLPARPSFRPLSLWFEAGPLGNGIASVNQPSFDQSGKENGETYDEPAPAAEGLRRPAKLFSPVRCHASPPVAGMKDTSVESHPYFQRALDTLEGDLVILGGYRGSILRSATPPHRQLWVPLKVGLNIRKVNLEVGLNPEDEDTMEDHIIPDGMLTHIGPVDISCRLFKRLRASENARCGKLRVWDYGYDWRLSPHLSSRKLLEFLDNLPSNVDGVPPEQRGAIVIAHSLGGLITRHAINQRPDLVAGVVYAGVPNTCVNILGPLRNGDDVMMSSRVLTAQVNFTIRTSFTLLPLDGRCFFNKDTKEEYPVDFFNVNTWIDLRLSPCLAQPLPPLSAPSPSMVGSLLSSMASVMPNITLPTRKLSLSQKPSWSSVPAPAHHSASSAIQNAAEVIDTATTKATNMLNKARGETMAPQMNQNETASHETTQERSKHISTASTIPLEAATTYLTRTLAETKLFKTQTAHLPHFSAANLYPPAAVIYGKSIPTVYGAKVRSREAIRHADVYDELAFASGDGVVLARAAMLPEGYSIAKGGMVSSERGHVTLLGDLEAVGRALVAVMRARRRGVGLGMASGEDDEDMRRRKMRGEEEMADWE